MIIKQLGKEEIEYIETIAKWYFTWWNNKSYEEVKKHILNNITIIGIQDNELIGCYQILEHDNDNTELTPWFANFYINDKYRSQGYSKEFFKTFDIFIKKLKINKIYLHTKLNNYYEKFNWIYLKQLDQIRKIYYYETK